MSESSFQLKSYAKLNLTLNIFKKRSDGMHPISSVFQSISLYDTLTITPLSTPELLFRSNVDFLETDPNNLFMKLYTHFQPVLPSGLSIYLEKRIPIGGGLGGGSSNAATFIDFLNRWAELGLSPSEMEGVGAQFGSDIPYFFTGGTAKVTGIGDEVFPTHFPDLPPYFVLIVPDLRLSTPHLYAAFDEAYPIGGIMASDELGKNDFWPIVKKRYPLYDTLSRYCEENLGKALHLSGSGATTFLTADSQDQADAIYSQLQKAFPVKSWIVSPTEKGFEPA